MFFIFISVLNIPKDTLNIYVNLFIQVVWKKLLSLNTVFYFPLLNKDNTSTNNCKWCKCLNLKKEKQSTWFFAIWMIKKCITQFLYFHSNTGHLTFIDFIIWISLFSSISQFLHLYVSFSALITSLTIFIFLFIPLCNVRFYHAFLYTSLPGLNSGIWAW